MESIDQTILLIGDLSTNEREDVERYVRQHPEWAPLLKEARTLHALLAEVRPTHTAPDATAIAHYVLARALKGTSAKAEHDEAIEAAFEEHPALERQARAMLRVLEQVAAESEDPVHQFERLTGHQLAKAPAADRGPAAPVHRMPRWRAIRMGLAACVALFVVYGGLALISQAVQPERATLADLGRVPDAYEGLRLRGEGPADQTADSYASALDHLDEARSSTLGLFPTYDEARLNAAADELEGVIETSGEDSWEGLEALYVLGKIRLYQDNTAEALWALQSVVALDGPHAAEARRLLDHLQAETNAD
ncbi:MAG: hypothetical protein HKN04_01325 [Rhodothermaceae bacterium]|nr:hypothetical protein [Rhodothermaceae bacterium]